MWLAGTDARAAVWFRHDIEEQAAERVAALAAGETERLDECVSLIGGVRVEHELTFVLRDALPVRAEARLIASGTPAGDALLARLESHGMPEGLSGMGFTSTAELWPPWYAALVGERVASVAFAARLGPLGAEVGVATAPEARGRGLASAVTAAWSVHPVLAGRAGYYTTSIENAASRRVAERLGLRVLGPTISIT